MSGFGWVGMGLVLIGLIIWLLLRLLPGRAQQQPTRSVPLVVPPTGAARQTDTTARPALEILDERLARGEVDVETYRSIRATIVESRGGTR